MLGISLLFEDSDLLASREHIKIASKSKVTHHIEGVKVEPERGINFLSRAGLKLFD
jgi:hypothetical protein